MRKKGLYYAPLLGWLVAALSLDTLCSRTSAGDSDEVKRSAELVEEDRSSVSAAAVLGLRGCSCEASIVLELVERRSLRLGAACS